MSLTPHNFDYIRSLLHERTGNLLDDCKEYLIVQRLDPLLRREAVGTIDELITKLRTTPVCGLHDAVAQALMTHETSFFRDPHYFEQIRKNVIPRIIKLRRGQKSLRIWCAACSSGQEPLSIAMLLREHFSMQLRSWTVHLCASDFSPQIIQRARRGQYTDMEINRGLPPELKRQYFVRDGAHWQTDVRLQEMVEFREINLVHPVLELPRMDLILLRNVLIYMDQEPRQKILSTIRNLLNPGGYLVLGGPETTHKLDASGSFRRIEFGCMSCLQIQ
jgi:chemotaxis protein methyltransferase CheR